jgi:hypothetical protein
VATPLVGGQERLEEVGSMSNSVVGVPDAPPCQPRSAEHLGDPYARV